ncbi:MAG TPA: DUF1573 domain-containing protein [Puia sp.]|nr:DUF1573 domain-containing protein [Puia sp.]
MQKIHLFMRHLHSFSLLFSAALAAILLAGCGGNDNQAIAMQQVMRDSARYTSIQWLDSAKDFGTIPEGQKVDVDFRFRNTGATPLVITQVRPSCGCTIAAQPSEPIAPGAEGHISATFNSQGHPGINRKTLFVTANTKGSQNYSLHFTVVVNRKTS